jgi:hypothetical protein
LKTQPNDSPDSVLLKICRRALHTHGDCRGTHHLYNYISVYGALCEVARIAKNPTGDGVIAANPFVFTRAERR